MIKITLTPTSQVMPGATIATPLGHKVVTEDYLLTTSKSTLLVVTSVHDYGMGVL